MHLRTMGHASDDLHELVELLLVHRFVAVAGGIFQPGVLPHLLDSGLQGLDPPTYEEGDEVHGV